ncbi:MAG: YtxH domain-containing protein [Deltaproteobacteria bacterium]|nr:YtxH domain-containing protein [Deltaproteobacteria bacterium]
MTNRGYTVLAFVLGGVVGAGVALLFAPASGEVTRKRIRDGATDAADRLTEKYEDVKETVAENAGKVKQMFEDKKEELKAVYEAGREAYIKGK